jgi:hypothetical protein
VVAVEVGADWLMDLQLFLEDLVVLVEVELEQVINIMGDGFQ